MGTADDLAAKLAFEPDDRPAILAKWREAEAQLAHITDERVLNRASVAFSQCYIDNGIDADLVGAALKAAEVPVRSGGSFDGRKP